MQDQVFLFRGIKVKVVADKSQDVVNCYDCVAYPMDMEIEACTILDSRSNHDCVIDGIHYVKVSDE